MVVPLTQTPVRGGRSLQLHGQPKAVQWEMDCLVSPQSSGSNQHVERLLDASTPSLGQRPILRQPGTPCQPPRMVTFNIMRQDGPQNQFRTRFPQHSQPWGFHLP